MWWRMTRPCAVCGQLFSHGNESYATCRSPRCMNIYRRGRQQEYSRRQAERQKAARMCRRSAAPRPGEFVADTPTRRAVISAWRSGDGLEGWDRLTHTALRAKVNIATAISVLRSSGVAA